MEQQQIRARRWRPSWRLLLVGVLLVALLGLVIFWTQRKVIAEDYINRELERRGVTARYRIEDLGLRRQRLVDVVIGDPARPDLVADSVIIDLSLGFDGVTRVERIRVERAHLRGRVADGRLRLGDVDKLLPPPTGEPFRLPDLDIAISDSSLRLDTAAGVFGVGLEGSGNLADGFAGKAAVSAPRLDFGDCAVVRASGLVDLSVNDRLPTIEGPVRAAGVTCPRSELVLRAPSATVDVTLASGLDAWNGEARLAIPRGSLADNRIAGLGGTISFDGTAGSTRGRANLAAAAGRLGDVRSGPLRFRGGYGLSDRSGITLAGDFGAGDVVLGAPALAPVIEPLAALAGTPLQPIAAALADAARRAGEGLNVRGRLVLVSEAGGGAVRAERLVAESRSGARLAVDGGDGLSWYFGPNRARLDGTLTLAGGGFPDAQVNLSQPVTGEPARGVANVGPMAAGNARLVLAPIRFSAGAGGSTRIDTLARLSGPFNDGYVTDLLLPVSGRFGESGFAFGDRCFTARFRSLRAAGLVLGATALPLCPTGPAILYSAPGGALRGGARIPNVQLAGVLGESPLAIAADEVRFAVADPGFTASDVAVRLGRPASATRLAIANLSGDFTADGVAGRFAGASGQIGNVPLLMSEGSGTWRVARGDLSIGASLQVADAASNPRFYPLVSDDFRLTLADQRIDAAGWLKDPETGTNVTRATIVHSLPTGRGQAVLDVPGLRFTPEFQPEAITRLTTGVIALVDGNLAGRGEISWSPEQVISTGRFSTTGMDLAAPFGPVDGLTTTIEFTDLLGLVSAPGQVAGVDRVQTGIDVFEGRVRYQLLPDLHVRVEGGRWPYAGGELLLEETLLDFGQESAKRLTFRLVGLDAARFVQDMEFDNISATGTFDGVIPMIFDQTGGRIVGGRMEARPPGGTLSYIGELSDRDLGAYGKLAFDALKSLRYSKLDMDLDGSLDGEFVTRIDLDGVARDPALAPVGTGGGIRGLIAGRALSQLARIPFEFNITVRGPFRALLATARSLEDPTLLIQRALPGTLADNPNFTTSVQPKESEPVP